MSLVFENVSKSFASVTGTGVTCAIQNVNLTIEKGEFVSIVGPSGCGKSTLLRMVAGLIPPTTGTITNDGEVIKGTDPKRGMAFQKPTLFPWLTVEKNIDFGLRMQGVTEGRDEKVDRMLQIAGLEEFRKSYPHHLSGGMAQRCALVRTMIDEPEIFLLDEPLGALDAFTRMAIQDELISMWQEAGNTMIMVTHDVDEAIYLGSRVIVMAPRPGRIIEDLKVELPEHHNRTSKEFLELRAHILNRLDFGRAAD